MGKYCGKILRAIGVWRRLVARYLGVVEAVGSSPVTPTSRKVRKHAVYGLFSFFRFRLKTRLGHHRGHHFEKTGKHGVQGLCEDFVNSRFFLR